MSDKPDRYTLIFNNVEHSRHRTKRNAEDAAEAANMRPGTATIQALDQPRGGRPHIWYLARTEPHGKPGWVPQA